MTKPHTELAGKMIKTIFEPKVAFMCFMTTIQGETRASWKKKEIRPPLILY